MLTTLIDPPYIVGGITLVRWIEGNTYESDAGVTYYSGEAEPSEADAEDCLATPREPAPALATIAQIKGEAGRRIFALVPAWQQANMTARTLELTLLHGTSPASWPAPEQAEHSAYQEIWTAVKAIRSHSNTLELDPPTLAALPTGWPA